MSAQGRNRLAASPEGEPRFEVIGSILAMPARARMLAALTDGRALPAGMLASEAGVAPSTASDHLGRLLDAGLVTVEAHGRHRYYRLAGAHVANMLERLAPIVPTEPVRSLRAATRANALRLARTCYDHLAGRLGVALLDALIRRQWIAGHDGSFRPGIDHLSSPGPDMVYELTSDGEAALTSLGISWHPHTSRPVVRHCIDWSEQRHHLSGHLGAAITSHCFANGWVERGSVPRAVIVTAAGREGLTTHFAMRSEQFS